MTVSSAVMEEQTIRYKDEECGIGRFRPKLLQVFANINSFVAVYSISSLLSSTISSFGNSQIPMLEKQFGFSSGESGFLMSCNDIGFLCTVLFSGYLARKVHIPRGLGVSILISGACGILCALPYFIQDKSRYDLDTATSSTSSNTTYTSSKIQIPMCLLSYGNSSTGRSNTTKSNSDVGSTAVTHDVQQQLTDKKVAFAFFAAGMVLLGMVKSARSPFITLYLDDWSNKKKTGFYLGILSGTGIFGPALAYLLGGYVSKIYVTLKDVDISPRDPRWIGAWWLGFVVFGMGSIVFSVPLFCFPRNYRKRRHASVNGPKKDDIMRKTSKNLSLLHEGKLFLSAVLRVLRTPIFAITAFTSCISCLALAGYIAFLPKYISSQYSIPLWQANIIMASCTVLGFSLGSFCGGFISRGWRMTPQNSVLMLIIFNVIAFLIGTSGMFFGCDQPKLLKDVIQSAPTDDNGASHADTCSNACACSDDTYFPICGEEGRTYYSPCHAGCTQQTGMIFSNCTCIPSGKAISGLCDQGCTRNLYIFAAVTIASALATAVTIVPSILIHIRCVEDRDRAVATAVSSFLISTFGWMAGPVIFGQIIDGGCILWLYTSGERQHCMLYDIAYFRTALHVYSVGLKIIYTVVLSGLYVYFRITRKTAWRDNDEGGQLGTMESKEMTVTKM